MAMNVDTDLYFGHSCSRHLLGRRVKVEAADSSEALASI
jgi:hypothetical protein